MTEQRVKPFYIDHKGILLPGRFSKDACQSAIDYLPKTDDIFIVTYPKCGTTWMQHIVSLILRRGKSFIDAMDFFINSPFLEMTGADVVEYMTAPGALKLHLPLHLTPFYPHAKYIYVARNPKDCCVSLYHHTKTFPLYLFQDGTFDDFFDLFVKGEVEFGDYFDHLIPWYEHRNDPNVYFLTYENLKKDTKEEILKIAKFIGEEHEKALLEDDKLLEDVLHCSSIDHMKKHVNTYFDELFQFLAEKRNDDRIPLGWRAMKESQKVDANVISNPKSLGNKNFVRKGIVGDWKNHFTSEHERRLKERIREKTARSDVMDLWENIQNFTL